MQAHCVGESQEVLSKHWQSILQLGAQKAHQAQQMQLPIGKMPCLKQAPTCMSSGKA